MNKQAIQSIVAEVVQQLSQTTKQSNTVPMAVSARHCHLSIEDVETLFGEEYQLTKKSDLSQPGQFAANETVTIVGPKGSIEKVRVLGPARSITQVEVSKTDAIKLGAAPPLRESGDIKNSEAITLVGPKGSIYKKEGLIVARAHIHMTPDDAEAYGVKNGHCVRITSQGERPTTLERVLIRVSPKFKLEMHIDTDEANAGLISTGATGILSQYEEAL
ncbi:phosphate propanoyltransferase [Priestia megaterium]|uniref:phosphate propanoyltransferase n=1 Tax=Priestia megaterium TaxID=1404 RepID=UPI0012395AD9|nr:phosphate propanoyltransferase [Priestia megaterium]KAA8748598.1 phosphate propanoyltransferase [Priestia megaterium]